MKVVSREVLWSVQFVWRDRQYIVVFKEQGASLLLDRVRCSKHDGSILPLNRARREIQLIRDT
jgi:hypothetical protein